MKLSLVCGTPILSPRLLSDCILIFNCEEYSEALDVTDNLASRYCRASVGSHQDVRTSTASVSNNFRSRSLTRSHPHVFLYSDGH